MKTKIVVIAITLVAVLMSTGLVYAEPGAVSTAPLTTLETLAPTGPELTPAAGAVITPTQQLNFSKTAKQGEINQHTNRENAPKGHIKEVYGETDPTSTKPAVYIIQLKDASLSTYKGEVSGLAATSPQATGETRLNARIARSKAYLDYLGNQRSDFKREAERALGHPLQVLYEYGVVYNGLAVKMTPVEAAKLLNTPGVVSVQRDQWRYVQTSDSPTYLGVPGIWDGSAGGGQTQGEGVIVGVIDTGIWPEHPSFSGDGFSPPPADKWSGICQPPGDDSLGYSCNNKLIGMRYFLNGYVQGDPDYYDGLFFSARDDDGHGTHTSSTAAGNQNVNSVIYGIERGPVSGMAPKAWVAAYKGLGPQGGVTSDLVAAIDAAVSDGVDVINYSVGSSFASDPWVDADAQAYLNAMAAGVFVATSAGNSGPGPGTIGSPANAPWVTSVGASYFNRMYVSQVTARAPKQTVRVSGATTTPGIKNFRLVDAEGIPDVEGNTNGTCINPFPPGTFLPTDAVLCERGFVATWAIGNFVNEGGGGAVILYNNSNNYDYNSYLHAIPTVVLLRADGLALKNLLQSNSGKTVQVNFTQGEPVHGSATLIPADTVSGFSSRGPNINEATGHFIDVLKPDVTAPGMQILAGASPQHVSEAGGMIDRFGRQNELFQVIQGTSMSSPHIAGLGALLKALHPDWTPAEIKSALMMTAKNDGQLVRTANDTNVPATPFDAGTGRIQVVKAAKAGFVLDETAEDFTSADPALGGDPSTLNLASLTQSRCLSTCQWTRVLRNTYNKATTWEVTLSNTTTGLNLSANPTNFTLLPGGTQVVTITAEVGGLPFEQWAFGELRFNSKGLPQAHFPVVVQSVRGIVPSPSVEINTRRDQGRYLVHGFQTLSTPSLTATLYMGAPNLTDGSLSEDPTSDDPYDDLDQVFVYFENVPASARRFIAKIVASTAPDMDMFVGVDDNGNNRPDPEEERCSSTSGDWEEICDFPASGESLEAGNYWIIVENWAASSAASDDFTLSTVVVGAGSSGGGITAVDPGPVTAGAPFDLEIRWNDPTLQAGDIRYGLIEIGPGGNVAQMSLTFNRLEDDVTKTAVGVGDIVLPGDTVDYEINIDPEPTVGSSMVYHLVDTLPDGLIYAPGSANVAPTEIITTAAGVQLVWDMPVGAGASYRMTTSATDPNCDTGFGGYVNLEDYDLLTEPSISGNDYVAAVDDFYGGATPFNFFGTNYENLYLTNNGFVAPDNASPTNSGANVAIPNPAAPNNLIAPFWRDLNVVYDEATNRGVTIAGIGNRLMVVEYDDVEPAAGGDDRYDFEVVMRRQVDDTPGVYEVVLAYDNVNGSTNPATIGLENETGSQGVQYAHNETLDLEDLMICFDWTTKNSITYQVTVGPNPGGDTTLVNTVEHTIDAPFTGPGIAEYALEVTGVAFELTATAPEELPAGPINYTLTITNNGVSAADNLTVTYELPNNLEYVGGADVISGSLANWHIPSLPGHASISVTLAMTPSQIYQYTPVISSTSPSVPSELSPSIVGGVEAEPGAWPWQVALIIASVSDGFQGQFCGGSLIAPDWVMTAGHCPEFAQSMGEEIDVVVGRHTLSSDEGQRIRVDRVIIHPNYDPEPFSPFNDIALLHLSNPATLSDQVSLISLISPTQLDLAAPDTMGMVTGWGDTTNGDGYYADDLYQVNVPVVSNDTCAKVYKDYGPILESMICAGFYEGGKDSCYGDSGGPLVMPDGHGGWKQGGIVSSGLECAQPQLYGTYTRVSSFYPWLSEGMNTYISDGVCLVTDGSNAPGHTAACSDYLVTVIRSQQQMSSEDGSYLFLPLIVK